MRQTLIGRDGGPTRSRRDTINTRSAKPPKTVDPPSGEHAASHHDLTNFAIHATAAPVQRLVKEAPGDTPRSAAHPPADPLPAALRNGIEQLSGLSMEDVRVHRNSSHPATVGAHAFARGAEIHLAPGQERHLPHEAWHVVQQKQGRVRTTGRVGGLPLNDEATLEREADAMGRRAATASRDAPAAATGQRRAAATETPVQRALAARLVGEAHGQAAGTPIQLALARDLIPEQDEGDFNLSEMAAALKLKGSEDFVWLDGGKYQAKAQSHIHLFSVDKTGMTGQVTVRNVKEKGGVAFKNGVCDEEAIRAAVREKFWQSEADDETVDSVTGDLVGLWDAAVDQWEHVFGK